MRASAEMIFYADEIEELFEVLEKGYQSNGNIVNLGLICNFDLGLRGGELCALKWLDINWINETLFVYILATSSDTSSLRLGKWVIM